MSCYNIVRRSARDRFSSRLKHCFCASERCMHTYLPLVFVYHNITQWTSVELVSKHCFFYYYIISLADTLQQRSCTNSWNFIEKKPETFLVNNKKKVFFFKNLYFFISSIILYFCIIICVLRDVGPTFTYSNNNIKR